MVKKHDIRIDRTLLHPWLDYKLTKLLAACEKKGIYLIIRGIPNQGIPG